MESFIIYLTIILFAIFSGIKNYKKENAKNKERAKKILSQPIPTIKPFQKKVKQNSSTTVIVTNQNSTQDNNTKKNYDNDDLQTTLSNEDIPQNINPINKNPYNNLARIEEYSDANEKAAFFIESEDISNDNEQTSKSFDLELNTPEDYKRAFVHTLIFDRKY